MRCAACAEVVVEFVEDYVGVVEVFTVGYVDGFVSDNVAALMFDVSFWHAYLQFGRGHMAVLA